MKSILKNQNKRTIVILFLLIISLVIFCSIAYSAFSSTMNITGMAHARVEANVRITDFSINKTSNATSSYEEFGKNHVTSSITLTNSTSKIYYNLEITNYGTTDVGIYSITGLPNNVKYSIEGYNLKDKICDDSGSCNSFIKQTYRLEIYTDGSSFEGDIKLDFEFKPVHKITYKNFTGNYIDGVMDGESVEINLSNDSPKFVYVNSNTNVTYNYENGLLKINNVTSDVTVENVTAEFDYDYTGNVQTFTAEYDGIYQLETWGAQGGGGTNTGYGGYSKGDIKLRKGETIYIYTGGRGKIKSSDIPGEGGYNGGGRGGIGADGINIAGEPYSSGNGGGGATHVAKTPGLLSTLSNNIDSILIVSGGGGGYIADHWGKVGHGGGFKGGNGETANGTIVKGGTQTTGHAFGKGADGVKKEAYSNGAEGSGGGGGGFYGGETSGIGVDLNGGGGGGSGYIGNNALKNKYMSCYLCETSEEESTKTMEIQCVSSSAISDCSKKGNGYAKITMTQLGITHNISYTNIEGNYQTSINDGNTLTVNFETNAPTSVKVLFDKKQSNEYIYTNGILTIENVSKDVEIIGEYYYDFDYLGSEQTFTVPYTGIYKLEVWGAQGKTNQYATPKAIGGYGGYSTGVIQLTMQQNLYITVGQYGQQKKISVGGGGYGDFGGGGATHIATKTGTLASLESFQDSILIVAGGGGGNDTSSTINPSGGGFKGSNGIYSDTVYGGTQTPSELEKTENIGKFGQGGASTANAGTEDYGAAGGGGFYGGDGTPYGAGSGGGGSGYIGNSLLYEKVMYCYNCEESSEVSTKTNSTENVSDSPISYYAKENNGYAKITLLEVN